MIEEQIRAELMSLLSGISSANGDSLLVAMENLENLLIANRSHLDPQLVHYLERRSYPKALAFLGGASDIPVGTCAPRRTLGSTT